MLRNVILLLTIVLLGACTAQRSRWVFTMEASDSAVQAALASDSSYPYIWDIHREMTPVFDPPVHLRPCCAFGKDLKVKMGKLPIPVYKVANVVGSEDLGPHVYDAGFAGTFPEYPSAYSLEDLFSNMLGTKIAAALIYSLATSSDQLYARNFDIWIKNTVDFLGAVPQESTKAYIGAVDKLWWDSSKRLPEKYLVIKRVYDVGLEQRPLLVPEKNVAAAENPALMPCDATEQPVQLSIATSLYGFEMADLVTVQITLDPEYQDVFAFPSDRHRAESRVTQADFQKIADAAREHDEEESRKQ